MTFLTHLYGLASNLSTATIVIPLIITFIFFHKPLINACISIAKNTLHALKLVCLSIYYTATIVMTYLLQAYTLLLTVALAPLQLFPFYNLYGTAYLITTLVIIPSLANRISPSNIWQFFQNTFYTIASSLTHFTHFITSPFQAFYHYIRGQRHVPISQPSPQSHVSTTATEPNHTSTSATRHENENNNQTGSLPAHNQQNQISTVTRSDSTALVQPSPPRHQDPQPISPHPVRDKNTKTPISHSLSTPKLSSQPTSSWFTRAISTSMQPLFYMIGAIVSIGRKLALTIRYCLWLLLIQCPRYLGKAVFFLAKTLIRLSAGIAYRLLQVTLTIIRSLGNNLSYFFCHSLPGFARSSLHYFNSYRFFQHILLAITLFQARTINLSIQAVYTSFGFSSYITSSALILSCPFLILGLYKLNFNLISTLRQKVFHTPPLPYPNQLYALFGYVITSTVTYCITIIGNLLMTLSKLYLALPESLYQTRQDNPSQRPSLHDFYEDTVPVEIRSSWEHTLRSNLTVAHGNQPAFETSSFLQSIVNSFTAPAQNVAPISLLDQIKGKDNTWPCTDDIVSHLDESTKTILQNSRSLTCPITHDLIRQPIICSDGNTYEKKELLNWLKEHRNVSPLTREPIVSLSPNRLYIQTLQQAIHLHQAGQTLPDTSVYTFPTHPKMA